MAVSLSCKLTWCKHNTYRTPDDIGGACEIGVRYINGTSYCSKFEWPNRTCDKCWDEKCHFRGDNYNTDGDDYNTDGDCLMSK